MNQEQALDQQLNAYGQRAAKRSNKKSTAEILGYAAAAGGMAFAGGDALGAIITNTTGTTFSKADAGWTYFNWNIDGAGATAYLGLDGFGGEPDVLFMSGNANVVADHSTSGYANVLSPGFVVGPMLATGTFNTFYAYAQNGTAGPFLSNTQYIGFRFTGTTGTPGTQYGWAKIRVDTEINGSDGIRLTISEWAYDNGGAAITVGDTGGSTGSAPAPATPLLVLLGLGAAGVQTFRKRRDAVLKDLPDEKAAA